jgi:ubiquitin-conjugating enzyme E2 W
MSHIFTKRLTKELAATKKSPPDGIKVLESDNLSTWYVQVTTASDSLYQGETFLLRFNFGKEYPMDSPEVEFVTHVPNQDLCILYKIPVHPHIYSNGHIWY